MEKITVYFKTPLGHRIGVETTPQGLEETLRRYGKMRWTPEEIPRGGWIFPLANHEDFPWEMIGARPHSFTNDRGETVEGVYYGGDFYRRRNLAANPNKNLPEAIKYSRGARPTDPEDTVESDGQFSYVPLITFRGSGKAPLPGTSRGTAVEHAIPKPTLEERLAAAKRRIADHANTLPKEEQEKLREELRLRGLTAPPNPLTEDFVKRYEHFVMEQAGQP